MPIIKADNAVNFVRDAVVLDFGDLSRQAARLRAKAEARASQIMTDAEAQAARLIEGAEAVGFDQGRAEGIEQGKQEGLAEGHAEAIAATTDQLEQVQQAWTNAAAELNERIIDLERHAKTSVLQLALRLAEKLVHRVIEVDPSVVVDQLAQALTHVLRPVQVTVSINPADRELLNEAMSQLLAEFTHLKHIELVDDPQVSAGGCIVSYGQGQIDADIDTQLERVINLMLPAVDDAVGDPHVYDESESRDDELPLP